MNLCIPFYPFLSFNFKVITLIFAVMVEFSADFEDFTDIFGEIDIFLLNTPAFCKPCPTVLIEHIFYKKLN